jgi:hypothetical protein
MAEAAVAGDRFERVADGVSEVQDAAQAPFALVGHDHIGLDAAAIGNDGCQCGAVVREDRRKVRCHPVEQIA